LNTILTQLVSYLLSTYFYDIKIVQTLYPTSHKLNVGPYGFILLLQNILNILSCVHIKNIPFLNWTLGILLFFVYFTLPTLKLIFSLGWHIQYLSNNFLPNCIQLDLGIDLSKKSHAITFFSCVWKRLPKGHNLAPISFHSLIELILKTHLWTYLKFSIISLFLIGCPFSRIFTFTISFQNLQGFI